MIIQQGQEFLLNVGLWKICHDSKRMRQVDHLIDIRQVDHLIDIRQVDHLIDILRSFNYEICFSIQYT